MEKICFVVQRYGLEVNGGAELQCRQFAEHLLSRYKDIHVLTTKAIDYMTWENVYEKDFEVINGIKVHRFSVDHPRNQKEFDEVNGRFYQGLLKTKKNEYEWMEKQGPASSKLIQYIVDNKNEYDVFVFFTYLYYTTALGVKEVYDKAIVIPEAHDDPFYKMRIFDDVFLSVRGILYNTEEERQLIQKVYHNEHVPSLLGGTGVEIPDNISAERFKKKYKLDKYVIYVGRIDSAKNCHILFEYFQEYKKRNNNQLKLVLMGKTVIEIPKQEDIVSLGFVSDEDKFDGIAGAECLVLPSEFESLSMVVLEAMSVYTPVMVYGKCAVLRGHCIKSNGAFYYNNFFEFEGQLNYLLIDSKEKKQMVKNAYYYVQDNFRWEIIMQRLCKLISLVIDKRDGE